ncbi:hypothetical protein HMPREF1869_01727 [Bacteroidales bacterium KA00251]|nr:hypothetical protein HMPREF1869_01727 [Bacteroidales bacterium KA00251]
MFVASFAKKIKGLESFCMKSFFSKRSKSHIHRNRVVYCVKLSDKYCDYKLLYQEAPPS